VRALGIVVLVAVATAARADVELGARPELRLSAGYDDNLFLDAQPAGPNPAQIHADGIFDLEARLYGWLHAGGHTLTLSLDYLERVTVSTGDLRDLLIGLDWRSRWLGPVTFVAGARYEHWATWLYPEDTFDLGSVDAGIDVQAGSRVVLEARYRFGARGYEDPSRDGQRDLDQRVRGLVGVRATSWLKLEAAYTYVHIGSTVASAELDRHFVELAVRATPLRWLSLAAGYGVGPQHLPAALNPSGNNTAPRDDLLQSCELSVSARPLAWLELFARYSLVWSSSNMPGGQYHRNQVLVGAGARWDFVHLRASRPPLAPSISPAPTGAQVTFHHRAPPGRSVALIGDWNGWAPQPMQEAGGVYSVMLTLPHGRHEYAFTVDGKVVVPADAPAVAPDEFGGTNGVVEVP
jgi:hypothetical protein